MKKRVVAWALMCCILIMGLSIIVPKKVYAADTVNITVASVSGTVGKEVVVEIKATSNKKFYSDLHVSYDTSVMQFMGMADDNDYQGGGGTLRFVKESAAANVTWKIKFKLLKVGSGSVRVMDNSLFLDEDEGMLTKNIINGTIAGKAPSNYSSDNSLKSLQVSPGTLTPAFSPDVTKYTMDVGASCFKITVSAVAKDSKAKVGVSGLDIKEGSNTTIITVTAENGAKKTYTIITNKPVTSTEQQTSGEKVICEYDGEHYFINQDYTIGQLPYGFDRVEITYGGKPMYVGKNKGGLCIMYLEHSITGVGAYYVYDTVKERFSPFVTFVQEVSEFIILDITDEMEKPLGYELVEVDISDRKVDAMKNGEGDFYLLYGMNGEGITGWYSYDSVEKTVQRYTGVAPVIKDESQEGEAEDEGNSGNNKWKDIAIGAIAVALITTVLMIIFMIKPSQSSKSASHAEMLAEIATKQAQAAAAKEAELEAVLEAEEDEEEGEELEEVDEDDDDTDDEDEDVLEIGELPEEDDGDILLD